MLVNTKKLFEIVKPENLVGKTIVILINNRQL